MPGKNLFVQDKNVPFISEANIDFLVITNFSGIFSIRFHTILLVGGPPRARGWEKKKARHSGATYRISQGQEESPKYTNGTVFAIFNRQQGLKSETL